MILIENFDESFGLLIKKLSGLISRCTIPHECKSLIILIISRQMSSKSEYPSSDRYKHKNYVRFISAYSI